MLENATVASAARALLVALPCLYSSTAATQAAEDAGWPQWRGPNHDGISLETGWEASGAAEPLWTRQVGLGYSAVSLQSGRLYTLGYDVEAQQDSLWCLDAQSGELVWRHDWEAGRWNRMHGGGTNSTPTVEGAFVWAFNREGLLLCLASEDGELVWERQLAEELELELPRWGFAGSPLIVGDVLYLNVGSVLALDKASGRELWRSQDYGDAYSTPVAFESGGDELLAVLNGDGLAVLERADGEQRGVHPFDTQYDVNAATPIPVDGKLFISAGYGHGCAMLSVGEDGLALEWESRVMRNQLATSVLFEGHLYGFDESILKCVDLDGNEQWRERGIGKGALMVAGGRIVAIGSRGELVVAEAAPSGYEQLSRATLLEGGANWTPPVLCNGLVYLRNSKGDLVCSDHRSPSEQ